MPTRLDQLLKGCRIRSQQLDRQSVACRDVRSRTNRSHRHLLFRGLIEAEWSCTARQRGQVLDSVNDAPNQRDISIEMPRCVPGYDIEFATISALRRGSSPNAEHALAMRQPGPPVGAVPADRETVYESDFIRISVSTVDLREFKTAGPSVELRIE